MDDVLKALADERHRSVVREIRRTPGQRQTDMLEPLGLGEKGKGTLSKLLAPLEEAGIVRRADGRYYAVEHEALGRLLSAAAAVDVGAKQAIADRAQTAVPAARQLAAELLAEE